MPTAPYRSSLAALAAALLVLGACGSSGGGGGGAPAGPQVAVSGTATYADVPAVMTNVALQQGRLDFAATMTKPIRGAVVEARGSAGSPVYSRSSTDAAGNYSVSAPANTAIQIVVLAALGTPGSPDTRVVNSGNATYGLALAHSTTATASTGVNLHAPSGRVGNSYTGNRTAAPFAILDTVYTCRALILSVAPTTFPSLLIDWSPSNGSGTFFDPDLGRITILGIEDVDTDEYDDSVVAHEWGHYFDHSFSRSDSLGGPHGGSSILDATVAFGEGFGNAFACIARNTSQYIDTDSTDEAGIGVYLDVEDDSVLDGTTGTGGRVLDGSWSETSVQELIWDVYDGIGAGEGDQVAMGWAPIQAVLTGPQRTTQAFTSIHSFLHHLKAQNGSEAVDIAALAAAENIGTHDEFDQDAVDTHRYTHLVNNGAATISADIEGDPLTTRETYGTIGSSYLSNRLYNRVLFTVDIPAGGTARIRVTPTGGSNQLAIYRPGGLIAGTTTSTDTADITGTPGTRVAFSVVSANGAVPFTIRSGIPATITKPSPAMPRGNG